MLIFLQTDFIILSKVLQKQTIKIFLACDTFLFPNSGSNTLSANVPAVLPIGTPVPYTCSGAKYLILENPTSNQCDANGMYGPEATCVISK